VKLRPSLESHKNCGVRVMTDPAALLAGVLIAFTDRHGGVGAAPYDTLNLALRVGDDPKVVAANRSRVAAAAGFDAASLALARQVHGADVLEVDPGSSGVVGTADVLVSRSPGQVVGILTADCAPVVVAGARGVAIAHAGWRGLVAGVIDRAVAAVAPAWAGWIGPSIHACCYEVGGEVVDAFTERGLPVAGRGRVDPGRAAAAALLRAGVEHIAASTDCTSCDDGYFSFRRDGVTGRQGAFVALL